MLASAIALSLAACEKGGFTYDHTPDAGNVQYTLLDTFAIDMRTVQIDSFPTSGTGVALVGSYNDPYFGRAQAGTYFRIGLPNDRTIPLKAVYDSIELIMKPTGYYYGDTIPAQRFLVYQTAEKIVLPDEYYWFYNQYSIPLQPSPLADQSTVIRPTSGELLHIRLQDAKGTELFNLLSDKAQEISSDDYFQEYFKGMAVRGDNNTAILGFAASDSGMFIRLHYHLSTTEVEEHYVDFPISRTDLQFNETGSNRSSTPIAALASGEEGLSSVATGKMAYLQSLTGVSIRMDLPTLRSLPELGKYGKILKAELVIRPVTGTYSQYNTPEKLTICGVDHLNNVTDTVGYGTLNIDRLYPENTSYTYDVSAYCTTMQSANIHDYRGLMLVPSYSDYLTQFNRLVIGDGTNAQYRAQLKIYYLLYQ